MSLSCLRSIRPIPSWSSNDWRNADFDHGSPSLSHSPMGASRWIPSPFPRSTVSSSSYRVTQPAPRSRIYRKCVRPCPAAARCVWVFVRSIMKQKLLTDGIEKTAELHILASNVTLTSYNFALHLLWGCGSPLGRYGLNDLCVLPRHPKRNSGTLCLYSRRCRRIKTHDVLYVGKSTGAVLAKDLCGLLSFRSAIEGSFHMNASTSRYSCRICGLFLTLQ